MRSARPEPLDSLARDLPTSRADVEALRRATNPDEFKLKIQGIQSTADISREEMEGVLELGTETDLDPLADESPFEFGNES